MAKDQNFLTIDIGAGSIKLCEFTRESDEAGLTLLRYASREYEDEISAENRVMVISGLLRQMLADGGFTASRALIGISGQLSLVRFARLPIGDFTEKDIRQMAEFESGHNLPYPVEEVVKSYQIMIGDEADSALDMATVVLKNDIAEQFVSIVENLGCQPESLDAASVACFNAASANSLGQNGCDIIVDMGACVTNFVFIEGSKFFTRTVPVSGHTITQQIARELQISPAEAEELKRKYAFVDLGEARMAPDSEEAATVSKIIRNIMVRMQNELQRTIGLYTAQQHGTKPVRILLCGGSSQIAYLDAFFAEKTGLPVEKFHPFQSVNLSPDVDRAALEEVDCLFGNCVGLALHDDAENCPLVFTLLPASIRFQQQLDHKKLLLVASLVTLLLWMGVAVLNQRGRVEKAKIFHDSMADVLSRNRPSYDKISEGNSRMEEARDKITELRTFLAEQEVWPAVLNELQRLKPDNLWLSSIQPIYGELKPIQRDLSNGAENATVEEEPLIFDEMPQENQQEKNEVQRKKITGLLLRGYSVRPDQNTVRWNLGESDPVFHFTLLERPDSARIVKEYAGSAEEEAGKPLDERQFLSRNQMIAAYMRAAGDEPANAFAAALQHSQLFDSSPEYTGLVVFRQSSNAMYFTIQVKLNFNWEYDE